MVAGPIEVEIGVAQGEAIRNSASVPLRTVLRAHSSAETMTTLGLPWRVMICGPLWARSITSERRALAPATVQ